MQGFQGLHYVSRVFTVLGPVLQHIISMLKKKGTEICVFQCAKFENAEFGLNQTVCFRISPFSGPRSIATPLRAITDTE